MRLFRRQIFFVHLWAIAAVCPLVAHGQDYSSRVRNRETDQAFRTLTHAKIFNLGGFGFARGMTRDKKAFRLLLRSGNSVTSFQRLLREANPEGQLYALYGLYLIEPDAFRSEVERLKHDDGPPGRWEEMIFIEKGKIQSAVGCVLFQGDRKVLVEHMANGDFDQAFKTLNPTDEHIVNAREIVANYKKNALKFTPILKY
jgi:hypothetical protein